MGLDREVSSSRETASSHDNATGKNFQKSCVLSGPSCVITLMASRKGTWAVFGVFVLILGWFFYEAFSDAKALEGQLRSEGRLPYDGSDYR